MHFKVSINDYFKHISSAFRPLFFILLFNILRTKYEFTTPLSAARQYRFRGFFISCTFIGRISALAPPTFLTPAKGWRLHGDGVEFAKALALSISRIGVGRHERRRAEWLLEIWEKLSTSRKRASESRPVFFAVKASSLFPFRFLLHLVRSPLFLSLSVFRFSLRECFAA